MTPCGFYLSSGALLESSNSQAATSADSTSAFLGLNPSGRGPCPWQGGGNGCSLTQTQPFCGSVKPKVLRHGLRNHQCFQGDVPVISSDLNKMSSERFAPTSVSSGCPGTFNLSLQSSAEEQVSSGCSARDLGSLLLSSWQRASQGMLFVAAQHSPR